MSMISELVKELRRADNPVGGYYRTLYARAADTIEELSAKLATANIERSTAYYNDGWIPCSERLPKIGQICLVTRANWFGKPKIEIAGYWLDGWRIKGQNTEILAWMPLPEPYKGGGVVGRLVKLTDDNVPYCAGLDDSFDYCAEFDDCYDCPHFHDMRVKLAHYEDLETCIEFSEEGRLK